MSHFDEQPDGDPHGECAAEIHRLEAELESLQDSNGQLRAQIVRLEAALRAAPLAPTEDSLDARGILKVATDLLRGTLDPLEVSAAIIEEEDGGATMEAQIDSIRKFLKDYDAALAAQKGTS